VLILVEWESRDAFDSYCNDPLLADLHPHRVNGPSGYIFWHLFDRLDDLWPIPTRVANPAQLPALRILIAKIRLSPF
jgi:hypothetical protein